MTERDTKHHHYYYNINNTQSASTIDVQKMMDEAEKRLVDKFAPWESIIHYHGADEICHYEADKHMEVKRQKHLEYLYVQAVTSDTAPTEPKFELKGKKKWD